MADQAAWDRAARPKQCKLASHPVLREHVVEGLKLQWSPEQTAGDGRSQRPARDWLLPYEAWRSEVRDAGSLLRQDHGS